MKPSRFFSWEREWQTAERPRWDFPRRKLPEHCHPALLCCWPARACSSCQGSSFASESQIVYVWAATTRGWRRQRGERREGGNRTGCAGRKRSMAWESETRAGRHSPNKAVSLSCLFLSKLHGVYCEKTPCPLLLGAEKRNISRQAFHAFPECPAQKAQNLPVHSVIETYLLLHQ